MYPIAMCVCVCVCMCVCVFAQSCLNLCDPQTHRSRILCSWNFPGKNTGAHCHFLLQGIFLTQGSNSGLLHLLHWQGILYPYATWETPASPLLRSKLQEFFSRNYSLLYPGFDCKCCHLCHVNILLYHPIQCYYTYPSYHHFFPGLLQWPPDYFPYLHPCFLPF